MKLSAAVALAAGVAALSAAPAFAQDVAKDVGHRVAQTARATGHTAAEAGRGVGHAVAQTGRDVTGNGPSHAPAKKHRSHSRHKKAG